MMFKALQLSFSKQKKTNFLEAENISKAYFHTNQEFTMKTLHSMLNKIGQYKIEIISKAAHNPCISTLLANLGTF